MDGTFRQPESLPGQYQPENTDQQHGSVFPLIFLIIGKEQQEQCTDSKHTGADQNIHRH